MSYCLSVGLKGGNGKEKLPETGPDRPLRQANGARNVSSKLRENIVPDHHTTQCLPAYIHDKLKSNLTEFISFPDSAQPLAEARKENRNFAFLYG